MENQNIAENWLDRIKAIKEKQKSIITKNTEKIKDLKNSTELSEFISSNTLVESYGDKPYLAYDDRAYLATEIIKANPEIIKDLTSSTKLSDFIVKKLNIADDFYNDFYKRELAIAIIQQKPNVISDLKDSQALAAFIVKELNITDDRSKRELAIEIIKSLLK